MVILSVSKEHITYGYVTQIVPFRKLAEVTGRYNYSASVFKGGHRLGSNVESLGNVMIYDFDDGVISLDEMESFLWENGVSAMLATSKSHQKEKNGLRACDRFRLFLPMHRRLKIAKDDYSLFYCFVAELFDIADAIDSACKDASRFYYPNPNQEVRLIETGSILDAEVLEKNFRVYAAALRKAATPKSTVSYQKKHGTSMKTNEVSGDTIVELRNGEQRQLREFDYLAGNETVPCRCISPAHEDRNPSAFIGRSNRGGGLQVKCVSCGYMAFMASEG